MKWILFKLALPIMLAFGVSSVALAQAGTEPATRQAGFPCEINLEAVGGSGTLTTFNSGRLCTGSYPNENIKLTCEAELPAGSTASGSSNDFVCTIATSPCGVSPETPEIVASTGQSMSVLDIDDDGDLDVRMICHWN